METTSRQSELQQKRQDLFSMLVETDQTEADPTPAQNCDEVQRLIDRISDPQADRMVWA